MLDSDLPTYRGLAKLWNIVVLSCRTALGGCAQIAYTPGRVGTINRSFVVRRTEFHDPESLSASSRLSHSTRSIDHPLFIGT